MGRPALLHTRRRLLRGGLALMGIGPLSGCGLELAPRPTPTVIRRIGILANAPDSGRWDPFRAGLRELGYVEGRNLSVEYRWAEGESDRYPELAAELSGLDLECLVTEAVTASLPAKRVVATTPIVAVLFNQDAVESGLVANIARPEGNVTGLAGVSGLGLYTKLPELLREAVPDALRMGVLAHARQQNGDRILDGLREAGGRLGVDLEVTLIRDRGEVAAALSALGTAGVRGIVFLNPLLSSARAEVAALALAQRLPAVSPDDEFPRVGGLLGYTVDRPDLFRRAAAYVDKLLRGAMTGDLPMERPRKFALVLNLKSARALGLAIPPSVLQQATEIIQ